jgi:hypothetical protein
MRRHGKLFRAIVLAVLAGSAFLSGATAKVPFSAWAEPPVTTGVSDGVRLLSATGEGVAFEVAVPWEQLRLETVTAGDKQYVRVWLPGWSATSQPGAPMLPQMAKSIGLPFGAVVSVRVEPGPAHTLVLPTPALPVVTQKVEWDQPSATEGTPELPAPIFVFEEDPAVYAGQAAYPGALAQVASDGVMRQQRVVGVAAYPIQYHPGTRELTIHEWLRVEVTFEGALSALRQAPSSESAAYENLFGQELLNYQAARAWRQTLAPSPSPMLGEGTEEEISAAAEAVPWAPPVPGWRVKVRADGFYRLTYDELEAAGLEVDALVPSTFQLYNLGSEAAIYVEGEADGSFDAADYILFYGQAVASKYTADNVYWLTYDPEGLAAGLRMGSRDGTPGTALTPDYYPAVRQMGSNGYYVQKAPGDDALERWFWAYVRALSGLPASWTHSFSVPAPYTEPYTATLRVALLGYLENPVNPDHHVVISLNGTQVGEVWWDGITWQTVEMEIAQSLLLPGNNTLSVVCPNDTGVGNDMVWVDWAELEFANTFLAEGDMLPFRYGASGIWEFQVDGFSSDELAIYDVTDPAAVVRIEGLGVVGSGPGPYSAVFEDEVAAPTDYWAMAETAYRTVQAIEADTASDLGSSTNGADYIVIAHQAFSAQAAQLRDFRASPELRAVTVDVQDVYDEFGYGIVGAAAIHDFLSYAYGNWQAPSPAYVVLVGDGHYDPKNYNGYGRVSYMPPYLAAADPWIVETAADNRYVTLEGEDNLPDMMLGRLAVNSSAEASAFVDKIMAYEEGPEPGDWQQQVLAVADDRDPAVGDFAQISDDLLACCLPEPYQAERVYYGIAPHTTVAEARAAILAGINAGKLIVNYIGHGATTQWAGEGLFQAADVAGLTNGGKLPVMLPMTCYDGFYHYPFNPGFGYDATAEVVTRAEGKGAVASWSPTGLGVVAGHDYLDRGFFQALFEDGLLTLGQATTAGKLNLFASGSNLDLLDTYLLFGDPALHIPIERLTYMSFIPLALKGY